MEAPKTNAARNRLIENLRGQTVSQKRFLENQKTAKADLERKIIRLQNQMKLVGIKIQEGEIHLKDLSDKIKELEVLEFNSQEKQEKNSDLQRILSEKGFSLEMYQKGLIPTSLQKELGLTVILP